MAEIQHILNLGNFLVPTPILITLDREELPDKSMAEWYAMGVCNYGTYYLKGAALNGKCVDILEYSIAQKERDLSESPVLK